MIAIKTRIIEDLRSQEIINLMKVYFAHNYNCSKEDLKVDYNYKPEESDTSIFADIVLTRIIPNDFAFIEAIGKDIDVKETIEIKDISYDKIVNSIKEAIAILFEEDDVKPEDVEVDLTTYKEDNTQGCICNIEFTY